MYHFSWFNLSSLHCHHHHVFTWLSALYVLLHFVIISALHSMTKSGSSQKRTHQSCCSSSVVVVVKANLFETSSLPYILTANASASTPSNKTTKGVHVEIIYFTSFESPDEQSSTSVIATSTSSPHHDGSKFMTGAQ